LNHLTVPVTVDIRNFLNAKVNKYNTLRYRCSLWHRLCNYNGRVVIRQFAGPNCALAGRPVTDSISTLASSNFVMLLFVTIFAPGWWAMWRKA